MQIESKHDSYLAGKIDDAFHDAIISLREGGYQEISDRLEEMQGECYRYLSSYMEHPNAKYYKKGSVEEDSVYENSHGIDEEFLERHDILGDDLGWLGRGDNGDAYTCGDGRVLKVTKSGAEYEIAKRLIGSKYDGIVEYFAAEKVGGSYYLLMEELDPIDDSEFNEAIAMLESQGLPITYLDHFDADEYEESHGEAPDMSFLNELWEVLFDLRKAGIGERADIRSENLGRDSSGKLKAFDVMERG